MSRYRPPQPATSPYITPEGYQLLDDELKQSWRKRREITQALSAAAAEGDRSENAEYIYRKKQLHEVDRRIRYLQKRLPNLTIVDNVPDNPDQIFFGALVSLKNENGEIEHYRIVGSDEFSHDRNYISLDSPLARALLKKWVGEKLTVDTPAGQKNYIILDVKYSADT